MMKVVAKVKGERRETDDEFIMIKKWDEMYFVYFSGRQSGLMPLRRRFQVGGIRRLMVIWVSVKSVSDIVKNLWYL